MAIRSQFYRAHNSPSKLVGYRVAGPGYTQPIAKVFARCYYWLILNLYPNETMARQQTQKLTRAQIRQGLDTIPIESLLSSGQGKTPKLTTKQRNFAQAVAMGQTKAQAYRGAYKAKPAPSTILVAPYKLAGDARVQREIEAYKLAIEAEKHRTPAQLKALLVQQLVQHSLDQEFPPASRVQCLKLLGSLYDVGAFLERKEITTINRSGDIRARLLSRLQTITVDAELVGDDALDLLAEIQQGRAGSLGDAERQPESRESPDDGATSDPTGGAPAQSGTAARTIPIHTIPLKGSQEELNQPEQGHPSTLTDGEVVLDFDR